MTTQPLVQPSSFLESIDLNHPALTELLTIDPNAVPLQHGLIYGSDGRVQVKPEIAAKLEATDPKALARALDLLAVDRRSEANSLVGCRNISNVTSKCPDNHEAEMAPILCGKPLLHEACATSKARVSKFAYEHPKLYDYLLHSSFQVLTFHVPHSDSALCGPLVAGRIYFAKFIRGIAGDHGWQWLAGFARGFEGTTFYAIHQGDTLPHQPTLESQWRRLTRQPAATLRLRTFDGRDGDHQRDGLALANSGFHAYWESIGTLVLEVVSEFRDEDLTTLYGTVRGFEPPAPSPKPEPELPKCLTCGKLHVACHGTLLLTFDEAGRRFDHIRPPSYGQSRRAHYGNLPRMASESPSPPS